MSRPHTGSRLALKLRRLRGRFGIAAPKLAVRAHIPWYFQVASAVGIVAVLAMLAGWAYDAGRQIAGFDQGESTNAYRELRQANAALQEEVAQLRSLLATSESSLQIEQAAQKRLAERNSELALENTKLKEEMAVFERLTRLEGKTGHEVTLDQLTVRADGGSGYRYSFLIALQGARRGRNSEFDMQLVITPRAGNQAARIVLPNAGEAEAAQYRIALRNFRRIEGRFEIPGGVVPQAVEVRIYERGLLMAHRSVTL